MGHFTLMALVALAGQAQAAFEEKVDVPKALARAGKENVRVLLVFGANDSEASRSVSELLRKDAALRKKVLYEYEVVRVDVGRRDRNMDLAGRYGAAPAMDDLPHFTVLSAEGKALAQEAAVADPKRLLAFLERHQAPPRKAGDLFQAALKEAREGKKRVLLTFGAPW